MKKSVQAQGLVLRFCQCLVIEPPKVVDGHVQDPIDGVSFAYTFDSADALEQKHTQYFEVMGSRGIYHEGWMASTFGPRTPWVAAMPDLTKWDPLEDEWQLFDTRKDYSLMNNVASEHPEILEELKALFMDVAEDNKVFPIGGALYTGINPHEMKRSSNTEWTLFEGMTRIPESEAPNALSSAWAGAWPPLKPIPPMLSRWWLPLPALNLGLWTTSRTGNERDSVRYIL